MGHVVVLVQDARGRKRDRACGGHVAGQGHQDARRPVHHVDQGQSNQQAPDTARQQRARHGEEACAREKQVETVERQAALVARYLWILKIIIFKRRFIENDSWYGRNIFLIVSWKKFNFFGIYILYTFYSSIEGDSSSEFISRDGQV